MHVTAIVPAAGQGTRFRGPGPKQFLALRGAPLLIWTLRALAAASVVDRVILAVPPGQESWVADEVLRLFDCPVDAVVAGGVDRQASVAAGLEVAGDGTDIVLVHDAARPLVTPELVRAAVAAAAEFGAAVVAVPVADTIKLAEPDGTVAATLPRDRLWAAQTPQAARAALLRAAHARALAEGFRGTDEAVLLERLPHPVKIVPGSPENFKITTPADLLIAERILAERGGLTRNA